MNYKRIEVILLILLFVFAFGLRLTTLPKGEFFGADGFYHFSIIEQNINEGTFSNDNNLDVCYEGAKDGHPFGFYLIPQLLGYLFGPKSAFDITPALFGALTVLISFFLFELIFTRKIAFIAAFLIAGTNAHFARSVAMIYKGDNLLFPFILGSLYLILKAFQSDRYKLHYAIAAGIVTGLTTIMWNGYILAIAVFNTSVIAYILFKYLLKQEVKQEMLYASLAIAIQLILVQVLGRLFVSTFADFYKKTYLIYFIIPAIALFIILELFSRLAKKNELLRYAPFALFLVFGAAVLFLRFEAVTNLMHGFGFVKPNSIFMQNIQELKPLSWDYLWFHMWIFNFTAVIGFFIFVTKLNPRRILYAAMLGIFVYMMISSKRYVFLASVPMQLLSALTIVFMMDKAKALKRFVYVIPIIFIIANAAYGFKQVDNFLETRADENLLTAYGYFAENTPENACLITTWEKGGMTQYYTKRHSYTSSVGGQNIERIKKVNNFYLTPGEVNFGIDKSELYVMVSELDLLQVKSMTAVTDVAGIGGAILTQRSREQQGNFMIIVLVSQTDGNEYLMRQSLTNQTHIEFYRKRADKLVAIKKLVIKQGAKDSITIQNPSAALTGCLFVGNTLAAYFTEELCDSNMVNMIAGKEIDKMERTYFKDGISIYRFS